MCVRNSVWQFKQGEQGRGVEPGVQPNGVRVPVCLHHVLLLHLYLRGLLQGLLKDSINFCHDLGFLGQMKIPSIHQHLI